ncbi:MAG TPA: alpha/beta hydrolase [Pyrinomonadaceae bacterium]|nr:alpha/beta hydrolase [Pyrinomonadaceae bacterium]
MDLTRILLQLIWIALLLMGSCFGPRTLAQQTGTSNKGQAQIWTVLAGDPKGDARDPALADAAQLSYRYDKQQDYLWFRVSLYGAPDEQAFGVNIAIDTGADDALKTNWWGSNNTFKFDKLLTAWVTRDANGFEGTIGVGDAAGVKAKQFNNLLQNDLRLQVEGDSILIGVKRTDITDKLKMNLLAAVGSDQKWNDDVPGAGSLPLDLSAERPTRGLREIDLGRNNFEFPRGSQTLSNHKSGLITKAGSGKQPLILVAGVYSGQHSFDEFIERNRSRYRFYVVTPPGINGTAPLPLPQQNASFGELTWTRRVEQDVLNLIRNKKLKRPVIVAESHPASIAVMELALAHPDKLGGVVISGTNLLSFFTSPTDPTRKKLATVAERLVLVNESWASKWFKFVTPETWNSNDMRPEMLMSNLTLGKKASDEIEAAQLEVKIRYTCEFWAADVTVDLNKLQVPVMALIPGFDEKFLADPANRFTKLTYVDSWETLIPKNPMLELVRIPDARLLILQDQPQRADEAITKFVEKVGQKK